MKFDISLSKIEEFIHDISENNLYNFANKVCFIIRNRNLNPVTFLKAFTFGVASLREVTLEKIVDFCKDIEPNFNMSKQALDKRLEKGALFLKEVFAYFLEENIRNINCSSKTINLLTHFSDIKIFDSTIIELSDKLATVWKGYNGDGSKSGIKVACMYSMYKKAFSAISIFNEVANDKNFNNTAANSINSNELAIADLGFFSNDLFKTIADKGGYFISKVRKDTAFYYKIANETEKFKRVDILELLKKSNGTLDRELYLGFNKRNRLKCRVIAKRLPDEVVNQKLRKANKNAAKKGKTVKAENKEMMKWIIMITNIEPEKLSVEDILEVYRIRWQIELIFKCWKSHVNLQDLKGIGKDYVECILYGKLILIIFLYNIYNTQNYAYYLLQDKELRMIKFFKILNEKYKEICINLARGAAQLKNLEVILKRIVNFSKPNKRKRKTTAEILRGLGTSPYKVLVFP